MKKFWTIAIIIIVALVIYKIFSLPDRELTPEEKRANVSVCHQYYGNGQDYENCVNGNNMGRD
jgi:hypothetical protein